MVRSRKIQASQGLLLALEPRTQIVLGKIVDAATAEKVQEI